MIFGFFIEASMRTSFNAFCFYLSDKFMSFTFFKAYSLLSVILRTLYTDEYAPSPVFELHLPSRLISWKSLSDIN